MCNFLYVGKIPQENEKFKCNALSSAEGGSTFWESLFSICDKSINFLEKQKKSRASCGSPSDFSARPYSKPRQESNYLDNSHWSELCYRELNSHHFA